VTAVAPTVAARPRTRDEIASLPSNPDVVAQALARGITEVLHFTRIRGIVGILAKGAVYSRNMLDEDDYLDGYYQANAADRSRDCDWWDYVNLSVSRINDWMWGASRRWHIEDEQSWVVLSFEVDILGDPGVVFTTTNNAYPGVERGEGVPGFVRLFDDPCSNGFGRYAQRWSHEDHWPTNRQAETLYPYELGLDHLQHIYAQTDDGIDNVEGALGYVGIDVETSLAPGMFE